MSVAMTGVVLTRKGDYEIALLHSQKALEIFVQAVDPSHVRSAATHGNIDKVHQKLGKNHEASFHLDTAQEGFTSQLGPKNPYTAEPKRIMGIASVCTVTQQQDHSCSNISERSIGYIL